MKYIPYTWSGMGNNYYGFKAVCPRCGHKFLDYTGVRIVGSVSNFCPDCCEKQNNDYDELVDALTEALNRESRGYNLEMTDDEIQQQIARLLKEARLIKRES